MADLNHKHIVIIGLGLTGLSCVNFFLARGIVPRVTDTRLFPPEINQLPHEVERCLGGINQDWLIKAMLIVISPGFSATHPALIAASKAGVEIIGDIELFVRESSAPIIAITGSNGKSTVTSLIGNMADYAGLHVGVGGNIGLPALKLLEKRYQLYILEISSFQLETTYSLNATAATILNISKEHVNRYPLGLEQYRAAKLKVYHQAKCCVINAEDIMTWNIFSDSNTRCITFGIDVGDYHLGEIDGKTWLMFHSEPIIACNNMNIIGRHNYINALAALALADAIRIPRAACINALCYFIGLPHRFELVYQRNGVRWINDSKATNIYSTEAALSNIDTSGTLHLLLGGDGKLADFSPLTKRLQKNNIRIYCFGRSAPELFALNPNSSELLETMEQAMYIIAKRVMPGDLVLLSPACSSLDQFKNFEVRGEYFSQLSRELG